jgi:hypothetical protein
MLSISFEPLAITAGTPIEQAKGGPVTGIIPRMDSIGPRITHTHLHRLPPNTPGCVQRTGRSCE